MIVPEDDSDGPVRHIPEHFTWMDKGSIKQADTYNAGIDDCIAAVQV